MSPARNQISIPLFISHIYITTEKKLHFIYNGIGFKLNKKPDKFINFIKKNSKHKENLNPEHKLVSCTQKKTVKGPGGAHSLLFLR